MQKKKVVKMSTFWDDPLPPPVVNIHNFFFRMNPSLSYFWKYSKSFYFHTFLTISTQNRSLQFLKIKKNEENLGWNKNTPLFFSKSYVPFKINVIFPVTIDQKCQWSFQPIFIFISPIFLHFLFQWNEQMWQNEIRLIQHPQVSS